MGMTFNLEATKKALRRKKPVIRYKIVTVVTLDGYKFLRSLVCPYNLFHKGFNCADEISEDKKGLNLKDGQDVGHGIHVYTSKKIASPYPGQKLLRVKCYPEHLVGASIYKHEVYTHVYISDEDWNAATK